MKRALNISLLSGIFLTMMLSFQNCSKVEFAGSEAANSLNEGAGETCRTDIVNSTKPIKVLFMIDTSGSNRANGNAAGTDPGKSWRLAAINSFLNAYASKSNFSFGFAVFQGNSATSLINSGKQVFSNNRSEIDQAIAKFQATPDDGSTPYDAALSRIKSMIQTDQNLNPSNETGYVVVMISDGVPTTARYTQGGETGMLNLAADVQSVTDIAPKQISINTVYLFNTAVPTSSQEAYLKKISAVGGGSHVKASSQQAIQITDTIQVPKTVCQ